jgi:putative flavoprotein involved in K+ transport
MEVSRSKPTTGVALPQARIATRLQYCLDPIGQRWFACECGELHPLQYRSRCLPDGGVMIVGASASGIQLAWKSRRPAAGSCCVGEHVRKPRTHADGISNGWMPLAQRISLRHIIEDIERARGCRRFNSSERQSVTVDQYLRKTGVEPGV